MKRAFVSSFERALLACFSKKKLFKRALLLNDTKFRGASAKNAIKSFYSQKLPNKSLNYPRSHDSTGGLSENPSNRSTISARPLRMMLCPRKPPEAPGFQTRRNIHLIRWDLVFAHFRHAGRRRTSWANNGCELSL